MVRSGGMIQDRKRAANLVLIVISVACLMAAIIWPSLAFEIGAGLLAGMVLTWGLLVVLGVIRRRSR